VLKKCFESRREILLGILVEIILPNGIYGILGRLSRVSRGNMSLNIKDPEAHELAAALAKATGESMTKAVTRALKERLERVRHHQRPDTAAAELLAIGARCAASLSGNPVDHGSLLYDELGLPK
jgi:antitoxin VapB